MNKIKIGTLKNGNVRVVVPLEYNRFIEFEDDGRRVSILSFWHYPQPGYKPCFESLCFYNYKKDNDISDFFV